MQAMILAAGLGSRLSPLFEPKPLAPICGMPMIEIGIRQAAFAGVQEVVVVTGHMAAEIEAALPAIARATGVLVKAVRTQDWSRPNGHSVLTGAAMIRGPYLLMMADHIFSGLILQQLTAQARADRGVTLAIDRRTNHPLIDPEDATWVQTGERDMIRAIGKDITNFNAVDCGAFLATEELAAAIQSVIKAGRPGSLSDGMQFLADNGRAATMDIGDAWWLDVDDARSHAQAETEVAAQLGELFGTSAAKKVAPRPVAQDFAEAVLP